MTQCLNYIERIQLINYSSIGEDQRERFRSVSSGIDAILFEKKISAFFSLSLYFPMSTDKQQTNSSPQHRIIFADRMSLTPNENDRYIKQFWMDVYKENANEGAVKSDGTIAWDCPCLGTQAIGPCSIQFRNAFSCYQNSRKEPKGLSMYDVRYDMSFQVRNVCTNFDRCNIVFPNIQNCTTNTIIRILKMTYT